MGGINYVTTCINLRAKGMTIWKLPLTVWGLFLTAVLNLAFVPVIAVGLIMLLFDRTFGTHFFTGVAINPAQAGQPLLYQHIFWAFGHPEVYILILPIWGVVSDVLSVFSRKPAFGYRLTALSMFVITCLSTVVWGHHMFISGMSPAMGKAFQSLTMLISIPSSIFFFNWLATLWRGNLKFTTPMLFAIGVIFVFAIGGLTGILLASRTMDIYFHGTYFVVAHFHYTMAMSVFLGSFCAIYFWFPKMFGRMMNETLGKIHFWITFCSVNVVFLVMFRVGMAGLMRRVADPYAYEVFKPLQPLNQIITYGVMVLGTAQVLFIFNFFFSMFFGKKAEDNPWQAATLEWTVPSPPPHANFGADLPVVINGPHEYGNPAVQGRDYLLQTDPAPGAG
jgi:cytochrome c oxidase subunit I